MSTKGRVLVVDDEVEMGKMLAEGLTDRGYDAISVTSASEALVLLEKERFDALVTDLRMPAIDGIGLLRTVRKTDSKLPVVVMTAFGAIDSARESMRQGASHYLLKPFKIDELAGFLAQTLLAKVTDG